VAKFLPESWIGRLLLVAALWAAVVTGVLLAGTRPDDRATNRPVQRLDQNYVSSDTCRSCHPGNYASWHASYHRTMTQVAKPENLAAGDIDGLELTHDGLLWRVERRGGAYFAQSRPLNGGASSFGPAQEVVLLTGSHHLQILWLATGEGRTLTQFPLGYIVAEKMWAPVTQTFLLPPEYKTFYAAGEWNGACMDCHVTQGRSRFVDGNVFDSEVSEFGISCEACHSEGKEHIAKNRNPLRRFALHLSEKSDPTVANPRRMDAHASTLACGQCHSIWAFNNLENKIAWNRAGVSFRPGETDLKQRFIVQPGDQAHAEQHAQITSHNPNYFGDRFWGDGMVRVTGREMNGTMASPCFKGGEFSCLSCHEMHPDEPKRAELKTWAADQIKPSVAGDESCLQCHGEFRAKAATHSRHAAGSAGASCLNCHLPHSTYGLLRAIRSHQVSSPTARESLDHGRPNACNLCHLDRPLAWTAEKLTEWYGQPPPATLGPDDREISAAARWLLQGDAGQRALIAWSMGWAPAQQASGRAWLYPYLMEGMNDPYAAVRFVAWKSLQTLPGFEGHKFTYTQEPAQVREAVGRAFGEWQGRVRKAGENYPATALLTPDGYFRQDIYLRLLNARDHRQVFLAE